MLFAIITALIFVVSIIFIHAIKNNIETLNSILQLFFMSLFVVLMYAGEARKYTVLCKIYENNHNIFKNKIPNAYWKIGSIIVFFIIIGIMIFASIYFKFNGSAAQ